MEDMVQQVLDNEDTLFALIFGALGFVFIVLGLMTSMVKAVSRERTRREIAAYIAEGSMSPEQGERLMDAGKRCG